MLIYVGCIRKWLLVCNFRVMESKKGLYYDGHEREDVVKVNISYLLVSIGLIQPQPQPHLLMGSHMSKVVKCPRTNFKDLLYGYYIKEFISTNLGNIFNVNNEILIIAVEFHGRFENVLPFYKKCLCHMARSFSHLWLGLRKQLFLWIYLMIHAG